MKVTRLPLLRGNTNRGNFFSVRTKELSAFNHQDSHEAAAPFTIFVQKAPIASIPERRRIGNAKESLPNRHIIERALYRTIENRNFPSFKNHMDKATLTTIIGEVDVSFVQAIRNNKGKPLLHFAASILGKHADDRFLKYLVEVGVPLY